MNGRRIEWRAKCCALLRGRNIVNGHEECSIAVLPVLHTFIDQRRQWDVLLEGNRCMRFVGVHVKGEL